MQIRVLSDDDVERLLGLDHLLEALAQGFSALSAGRVSAPPRNGVEVPAGFLLSMVAHAPEHPMGVELVSVFHGNHRLGLPGHLALISLFYEETGAPLAVMNGTYITAMRTPVAPRCRHDCCRAPSRGSSPSSAPACRARPTCGCCRGCATSPRFASSRRRSTRPGRWRPSTHG